MRHARQGSGLDHGATLVQHEERLDPQFRKLVSHLDRGIPGDLLGITKAQPHVPIRGETAGQKRLNSPQNRDKRALIVDRSTPVDPLAVINGAERSVRPGRWILRRHHVQMGHEYEWALVAPSPAGGWGGGCGGGFAVNLIFDDTAATSTNPPIHNPGLAHGRGLKGARKQREPLLDGGVERGEGRGITQLRLGHGGAANQRGQVLGGEVHKLRVGGVGLANLLVWSVASGANGTVYS